MRARRVPVPVVAGVGRGGQTLHVWPMCDGWLQICPLGSAQWGIIVDLLEVHLGVNKTCSPAAEGYSEVGGGGVWGVGSVLHPDHRSCRKTCESGREHGRIQGKAAVWESVKPLSRPPPPTITHAHAPAPAPSLWAAD